jgi:hypothetical protein
MKKIIATGTLGLILSLFAVVYVFSFGATFLTDPLGQAPVLDARENIAWADTIREGRLPEEPIYRALLYPYLLAKFPPLSLPAGATFFGLLMHLSGAALVGLIAARLWKNEVATWLSGLLFAVYPVSLYFAGQILDITFAMTLFLGGIYVLLRAMDAGTSRSQITLGVLAGVLGGLAVLARPNFLPPVLCFPVVILFIQSRPWKASAAIAVGLVLMLCLQGFVNLRLSGEFRLLPWQGAYNLFAANREGANGKYYTQRVSFDRVPAGANTTRMESEYLYRQAAGADAPMTVDAMNGHWRGKLVESISDSPLQWLGLMARKSLYVFNNWEQYNNLSYAYHKARWPMLAWNPLGWGVLLLAAFAGLLIGYSKSSRAVFYAITLLGLAYAAGLLLFFVSARFRLPLVPLLCIAAGGCAFWRMPLNFRQVVILATGVLGLSLLSFGNWFGAKDRVTFIQDELLLATASSQVGDDWQALELSRSVLARDPRRAEAQRLELTSLFNLWLVAGESSNWQALQDSLRTIESSDASVEFIRGVYFWRNRLPEKAVATWKTAIQKYGVSAQSSADALQAVGQWPVSPARANAVEQMQGVLEH